MTVTARVISFECVAEGHTANARHPDKLTIHEERWAFCPFNARATGHQWRETGGQDLDLLMGRLAVALSSVPATKPEPPAKVAARKR